MGKEHRAWLLAACAACVAGAVAAFLPVPAGTGLCGTALAALVIMLSTRKVPPAVRAIIWLAFAIRVALALYHFFVTPLPDSQGDALRFEAYGWDLAMAWRSGEPVTPITGAYFYSFLIGLVYSVAGRSALLIQILNVMFGALLVYNVYRIADELFPKHSAAVWAALSAAVFPTLALYSSITMREVAEVYPFTVAVLLLLRWWRNRSALAFAGALMALAISTILHVGFLVVLSIPLILSFWRIARDSLHGYLGQVGRTAAVVLAGVLVLTMLAASPTVLRRLGYGSESGFDVEQLTRQRQIAARSRAAYLEGVQFDSYWDVFRFAPVAVFYFLLAPFPWQITARADLVGAADAWIYGGLIVIVLSSGKEILRRARGKGQLFIVGLLLAVGIAVFAMGTSNYGTAVRHRAKFSWLLLVLACPGIRLLYLRLRCLLRSLSGSASTKWGSKLQQCQR